MARERRYIGWLIVGVFVLLIGAILLLPIDSEDESRPRNRSARPAPASPLERRAERIEAKLAANPGDEKLLLATMQAWIAAGNQRLSDLQAAERPIAPTRVPDDLKAGLRVWERYLRQTSGEAGGQLAESAAGTYFELVEIGSKQLIEVEANAAGAARAGRIAGRHLPTLFTLSNTAIYEFFNGEFTAGEKTGRRAAAAGNTKAEAEVVREQMAEYRERAEKFVAQVKKAAMELRASGEKELKAPIKGYGSPSGINAGYWPASIEGS